MRPPEAWPRIASVSSDAPLFVFLLSARPATTAFPRGPVPGDGSEARAASRATSAPRCGSSAPRRYLQSPRIGCVPSRQAALRPPRRRGRRRRAAGGWTDPDASRAQAQRARGAAGVAVPARRISPRTRSFPPARARRGRRGRGRERAQRRWPTAPSHPASHRMRPRPRGRSLFTCRAPLRAPRGRRSRPAAAPRSQRGRHLTDGAEQFVHWSDMAIHRRCILWMGSPRNRARHGRLSLPREPPRI